MKLLSYMCILYINITVLLSQQSLFVAIVVFVYVYMHVCSILYEVSSILDRVLHCPYR